MVRSFEELLNWQAELAETIIQTENDIKQYSALEKELLHRRERALLHHQLGLKNKLEETEFALNDIQEQLREKKQRLEQLKDHFQNKINTIIEQYQNYYDSSINSVPDHTPTRVKYRSATN